MDAGCRTVICLDDGAELCSAHAASQPSAGSFVPPPVVLSDLSVRPCQVSTLARRLSESKQRLSGHGSHTVPPGSQMLHPSGFDARQGHPCTVHRQGAWISRPPVAVHARPAESELGPMCE